MACRAQSIYHLAICRKTFGAYRMWYKPCKQALRLTPRAVREAEADVYFLLFDTVLHLQEAVPKLTLIIKYQREGTA